MSTLAGQLQAELKSLLLKLCLPVSRHGILYSRGTFARCSVLSGKPAVQCRKRHRIRQSLAVEVLPKFSVLFKDTAKIIDRAQVAVGSGPKFVSQQNVVSLMLQTARSNPRLAL